MLHIHNLKIGAAPQLWHYNGHLVYHSWSW